jgi:cytochrome P450
VSGGLARASLVENARFNATVVVPNAVQGIFRRRRRAVRAATAANVDGHAVGLLEGMNRSYEGGPVWVKLARDDAVLLLDPKDVARLLEGSPDLFASDPDAKRNGMVHFQPDALTISRGEEWRSRRAFTEAVLGGAAGVRVDQVTREEVRDLVAGPVRERHGELHWEPWNRALQRVTRRVILGDGAGGDWALTDTLERMMSGANGMPGKPAAELEAFDRRIAAYVERAEEGSLAAAFADAPQDELTRPAAHVTHWMFALGDTLAINALRCLVLLACHPDQAERALGDTEGDYLDACLHEAMRLWPTTTMLSRVSITPTEWRGEEVPAETQFVISNVYGHRDRERLDYADRFAPEQWTDGDAASYPGFNHFSRGPQGCPGTDLALRVGRTAVRALLERGVAPATPKLNPEKPLPHMLDFFSARVRIGA